MEDDQQRDLRRRGLPDQRIPALVDVLEELTGTPIIIEIKERRAGASVARVIEAAGAVKRVVVGAYDDGALREVRRAGVPTTASRRETAVQWLLAKAGRALRTEKYLGFAVPEYAGRLRVVDRRFVTVARKSGKPVHVWTVDDVAVARRLRAIGVAGILTNFPARMQTLSSE